MSDEERDPFYPAPRSVRPRKRRHRCMPVVALSGKFRLSETGVLDEGYIDYIQHCEPTLFVARNAADIIGHLDRVFLQRDPDHWQWRAGSNERNIKRPNGARVASRVTVPIPTFGFKGGNFHKIIDPVVMYGHRLDTIWPGDQEPIVKLLQWGVALRDFCDKNDLEVRPTIGAISAQFLTDRRFYPRARRKVPMDINQRARENLPGNHYALSVMPSPHEEFTALYLDQSRAHHYHAKRAAMPDSNQLYAHGSFTDLSKVMFEDVWPGFYGLYCLDLDPPLIGDRRRSSWITNTDRAFVFSNEIQHLKDMGYVINGVYAAWGSFKQDKGISAYAKWANKQLDHYGDLPWLKPLLLATYGTLATRPKIAEAVFRLAKRGETVTVSTGHEELTGKLTQAPKKLEPGIANVIHRGMIEAATRSESVGYAQYLTYRGYNVLSIYADAVIVEDNPDLQKLTFIPEPWRIKATLTHLQFINQQAFISGEMTKLPGSTDTSRYTLHPLARPL